MHVHAPAKILNVACLVIPIIIIIPININYSKILLESCTRLNYFRFGRVVCFFPHLCHDLMTLYNVVGFSHSYFRDSLFHFRNKI